MTSSGEPPSGTGGEADWIDQILDRATEQATAASATSAAERRPPIVPDSEMTTPAPVRSPQPAPVQPAPSAAPVQPAPSGAPIDQLAEIRWVDAAPVTPASTPIASPSNLVSAASTARDSAQLVPEAVGRSAWDDQLASVGDSEPEGWDKLSWEDLDDQSSSRRRPIEEDTSFARIVREWGPVLFAAFAIAVFTRLVLVQAYHIPSESMVPTLEDGDRVVVNRLSYRFGEIERGQVVVFAKPLGTDGENDLIKRVIALPGETIRLVDNQVYIDGFRVDEPYLRDPDSTRPRLPIPGCDQIEPARDLCVIPEGYVFVMGDNRLGSSDSRVFGPIPVESVVGRAFMRVWPLNNLGQL